MGNQHELRNLNNVAEGFLARDMARRLQSCNQCLALQYRRLVVAKCVNGNREPGPDGIDAKSWTEFNPRIIFYCPRDVLAAIEDEMTRSGRTKTQVIVEAVRSYLEGLAAS